MEGLEERMEVRMRELASHKYRKYLTSHMEYLIIGSDKDYWDYPCKETMKAYIWALEMSINELNRNKYLFG